MLRDIHCAFRQIRKNTAVSVIAISLLTFGLGASIAIYSLIDSLLLAKLPVGRPEELVWISSAGTIGQIEVTELSAYNTYRNSKGFSGMCAFAPAENVRVTRDGSTIAATSEMVSDSFFDVLQVKPFSGRFLIPDDSRNKTPVAILSWKFWQDVSHGDKAVVGSTLQIGDSLYTVIGVAPKGFFGLEVGESPDIFLPLSLHSDHAWGQIVGRLSSHVTAEQASQFLQPLFQQAVAQSSLPNVERAEWMNRLVVLSISRGISNQRYSFSLPLELLMGGAALVLLIACVNVTNLLLAREVGRSKEVSIRRALGASTSQIVRPVLLESGLLALFGSAGGVFLGSVIAPVLVGWFSSEDKPLKLYVGTNAHVLAFAGALTIVSALCCGLWPAICAVRNSAGTELRANSPSLPNGFGQRLASRLVSAQVTVAVVMLISAALLMRTLYWLETMPVGFDRDHSLVVTLSQDLAGRAPQQLGIEFQQILEKVRSLPEVVDASYSGFAPVSGSEMGVNVELEANTLGPGEATNERFVGVSPSYFNTMAISISEGRGFRASDIQIPAKVAVINSAMAKRYFADKSPIGKHLKLVEGNHNLQIVGVVSDSKYNRVTETTTDFFYVPAAYGSTWKSGLSAIRVS